MPTVEQDITISRFPDIPGWDGSDFQSEQFIKYYTIYGQIRNAMPYVFSPDGWLCVFADNGDQIEPLPIFRFEKNGDHAIDIAYLKYITSISSVLTPEEYQQLESELSAALPVEQQEATAPQMPEPGPDYEVLERLIARGVIDFSNKLDGSSQDPERVDRHLQAMAADRADQQRYESFVTIEQDPDCGMVAVLTVKPDRHHLQNGYREQLLRVQNLDEPTLRTAVNHLGSIGLLTDTEKKSIYWNFCLTDTYKNMAFTRQDDLKDPYVLRCVPQLASIPEEMRLDTIHHTIDRVAMERANCTLRLDQGWNQDGTAFSVTILFSGNDFIQVTVPHSTSELMANSQAGRDHLLYLLQDIGILLECERQDIEAVYANEMPIGNRMRLKIDEVASQIMPEELVQKTGGTRLKDFSYFPCLQPGTQHYLRTAKVFPSQAVYHYVALDQPDASSATQLTMANAFRDAIHGPDNYKKILDSIYRTMLHSPTNPVFPTLMRSKNGQLYAVIVHQPRRLASDKTRELMSSEAKIVMESALERFYRKLAGWRID